MSEPITPEWLDAPEADAEKANAAPMRTITLENGTMHQGWSNERFHFALAADPHTVLALIAAARRAEKLEAALQEIIDTESREGNYGVVVKVKTIARAALTEAVNRA